MLTRCFLDFSVGVWAFVIGLSQISSFLSSLKLQLYIFCGPTLQLKLKLLHHFKSGVINNINYKRKPGTKNSSTK